MPVVIGRQQLQRRIQPRIHGHRLVDVGVEVGHVLKSLLQHFRRKEPVGILSGLGVKAGQLLVFRGGSAAPVAEIVQEFEIPAAVGPGSGHLHGLPTGLGIQQRHEAGSDGHHRHGQQHHDQRPAQLCIGLGKLDPGHRLEIGPKVPSLLFHKRSLSRSCGAAVSRSARNHWVFQITANNSISAKNRMIAPRVARPIRAPFLQAL